MPKVGINNIKNVKIPHFCNTHDVGIGVAIPTRQS